MEILSTLYTEAIWRPLFSAIVFLYSTIPGGDFGVTVIVFTVLFRIVSFPLHWKARRAQQALAFIQPEMKKIQEKHKNDREAQGRALMELYAQKKVNPFSGCLPILIQLPILIALFQIFQGGFDANNLAYIYSFIPSPESINPLAFGFLDLSKGNIVLGFFAALSQYIQTKITLPPKPPPSDKPDFSSMFQKQTLYMLPLLVLFWSYTLPAALTFYWTISNIFGIVQDTVLNRSAKKSSSGDGASNGYSNTHK
ncbi:MAG: hypothetical protein A2847_01955 [Candidatus Sungbacteria bacterium RIFCSPHIGHO2_01_FULL_50_25]|uniref:Membrane insertase YidC/Oxa/ALB C-terminal domain-containing protein n=1 Tax=Candidatus Sungbacteria bacterium RIFCSPHIGHO2_01_FULL_50_25 TaxID=1802265 RepID=A0A1G2K8V7_9BACT|nr:MAG: hypothetical protein A2847_01955 [Candidatus Sungbacteria bacterium RIFCSPHIGHO2_01_FULL_50_25]